jgi:hypothetical protein
MLLKDLYNPLHVLMGFCEYPPLFFEDVFPLRHTWHEEIIEDKSQGTS